MGRVPLPFPTILLPRGHFFKWQQAHSRLYFFPLPTTQSSVLLMVTTMKSMAAMHFQGGRLTSPDCGSPEVVSKVFEMDRERESVVLNISSLTFSRELEYMNIVLCINRFTNPNINHYLLFITGITTDILK